MGIYVTLEQAKDHLRVDFDDDDNYISDLIDVAEASVANEIGSALASNEVAGELPKPLYQGILLMVGHLYNSREPVIIGTGVVKVPFSLEYLLAPYKTWTCK
jgi:uncharacterized phage protein (predicted DNA packaging)